MPPRWRRCSTARPMTSGRAPPDRVRRRRTPRGVGSPGSPTASHDPSGHGWPTAGWVWVGRSGRRSTRGSCNDAASLQGPVLVRPPWCHSGMPASRPVLTPDTLAQPGLHGVVRVVGGPGTGKSTMLVQAAAAPVASGVDPESILLLTGSSRIGMGARSAITAAVLGDGRAAVRVAMVRTIHSYAFAILRLAAQRNGDPPPRLITSAEQDGIIRELLAGDLEDGDQASVAWPTRLRPALATVGFATELRDLLARCAERGVEPVELQRIGRRAGRAEWVAAGRFAQVYEQVMLLRSAVGMAVRRPRFPRWAPLNWSARPSKRSRWTPNCWSPNGPGSGCCSSTMRSISIPRPPDWCDAGGRSRPRRHRRRSQSIGVRLPRRRSRASPGR